MPNDQSAKRPVGRPRADGKPQLSRKVVFAAAIKLIARHGYTGASLRMIAQELDVQAPSILQLFKTKENLVNELVEVLSRVSLAFHEALYQERLDADVWLYKMLYEETKAVSGVHRDVASIYYLPELRKPEFAKAQEQRMLMINWYQKALDEGVATGKFSSMNVSLTSEQVFQLTETRIIAQPAAQLGSPHEQALATADFALRSLLVRPSRLAAVRNKALGCSLTMYEKGEERG